jgi:hypothetical protein
MFYQRAFSVSLLPPSSTRLLDPRHVRFGRDIARRDTSGGFIGRTN